MTRTDFRIVEVRLDTGKARIRSMQGRETYVGGTGLAAMLFAEYGDTSAPWDHPDQPLIFAIGPLTGYFPLMSKTVCGFKSPYHDQYCESHAGGRSALALRFANVDGLVILGRAPRPCYINVGSRQIEVRDAHFLWGKDCFATGKRLRHMAPGSGHRSIMRIGRAGERGSGMACINVDTYRHFGRMGAGGVMGNKNLKAIVVQGDGSFALPEGKEYAKLQKEVHLQVTATHMMSKYHNLGTAGNVEPLNVLKSLPWRNLQASSDDAVDGISGEKFADQTLLRNAACAGCPVGCIHLGFVREKFQAENRYLYRQVSYDYEPIFACGSMLGVTDAFKVLKILDQIEREGLDCMSGGVALAWATEAFERGLVTEKDTVVPLSFGDADNYVEAVAHLGQGTTPFYELLAMGTMRAAKAFGGEDFACVLGQEMAGYATGEAFFVSESMSFRHSHLDNSAYSFDQKETTKDASAVADMLIKDDRDRGLFTSMVSCLFARGVYKDDILAQCLGSLGLNAVAENFEPAKDAIQQLKWNHRFDSGYDPAQTKIPKRYMEVVTWKGEIDKEYLENLRREYAARITALRREKPAKDTTDPDTPGADK